MHPGRPTPGGVHAWPTLDHDGVRVSLQGRGHWAAQRCCSMGLLAAWSIVTTQASVDGLRSDYRLALIDARAMEANDKPQIPLYPTELRAARRPGRLDDLGPIGRATSDTRWRAHRARRGDVRSKPASARWCRASQRRRVCDRGCPAHRRSFACARWPPGWRRQVLPAHPAVPALRARCRQRPCRQPSWPSASVGPTRQNRRRPWRSSARQPTLELA